MKQEIKDRWVTALRSGKYEQGEGYLNTDTGFCCLGVLCDIIRDDVRGKWQSLDDNVSQFVVGEDEGGISLPPNAVVEFVGLPDENPSVWFDGERISLAELNDGGHTFAEIADVIEEKL